MLGVLKLLFGINRPSIEEKKAAYRAEKPSVPVQHFKCGLDMVLRTAAKGANAGKQFYGCSDFPRCYNREKFLITTLS